MPEYVTMQDDGLSEEAGEGYFASISDLMVGVLFVFLLMLTVFALNFHDDSAKLADVEKQAENVRRDADNAKQQAKKDQKEAEHQRDEAKALQQEMQNLKQQNKDLLEELNRAFEKLKQDQENRQKKLGDLLKNLDQSLTNSGVHVYVDPNSGVLSFSDAIPFATGRSDLNDPNAINTVHVLADALAATLPCFARSGSIAESATKTGCSPEDMPILETVLVEGHTDKQTYPGMSPLQSKQENDRLSTARALTVFATLRQQQPRLDDLLNPGGQPLLGVSGYGERRPLPGATGDGDSDLKRNRRIDLRFVLSTRTSAELQKMRDQIEDLRKKNAP